MATEARVRRELEEERRQLADAVEILREDIDEAKEKAKKVSLGAAGGIAALVAVKKVVQALRRR
jgi:hypothetical protein